MVAGEQSAGRGRKDRLWRSPPGSLYFSIGVERERLLPLKASVAVARTLEGLGSSPALKWPNDVLLRGKKVCGILVESTGERAVVGIGLNVKTAPVEDSTCLNFLLDRTLSKDEIMKGILHRFYSFEDSQEVLEAYRGYCSTIGSQVKIDTGKGTLKGLVKDVDENGRLVLEDGKKVVAGDVVHLRKKS